MSEYRFTPQAVDDLFEIWSYIAGDNLDVANRVEEAVYSACAFLADSPLAGRENHFKLGVNLHGG